MRNGLNISGVSELVHEIRQDPEEALIDFRVDGVLAGDRVVTEVKTARFGTTRMARGFRVEQRLESGPAAAGSGCPGATTTPYESALAALGACALVTHINGFTARAVTLGEIELTASAELPLDASGRVPVGAALTELAWQCEVDCAAPDETLREVSRLVTAFSPLHRTFLDPAEPTVTARITRSTGHTETLTLSTGPAAAELPDTDRCRIEARLRWEYGTEVHARTTVEIAGVRRAADTVLVIDQPKQMLGIDKAPNPLELLLSAVCGELVGLVREEAGQAGLELAELQVRTGGRVDIRGMQNVLREVPARFQQLAFELRLSSDAELDELRAVLSAALARAAIPASLSRANTVAVGLGRSGAPSDTRYLSTVESAEALRDELTRQQEETPAPETAR